MHHTGPFGLGEITRKYLRQRIASDRYSNAHGEFSKGHTILLHMGSSVGNAADNPRGAVHRKEHRWKDSRFYRAYSIRGA